MNEKDFLTKNDIIPAQKSQLKTFIDFNDSKALLLNGFNDPFFQIPISISLEVGGKIFENPLPIVYAILLKKTECLRAFLIGPSNIFLSAHDPTIFDHLYSPHDLSLLHCAIYANAIDCIQLLLLASSYSNLINFPTPEGNTPLHLAIFQNKLDIIRLLLQHGANPFQTNKQGDSPFHISLNSDYLIAQELCLFLINFYPDLFLKQLTVPYLKGKTIIEIHSQLHHDQIVQLLKNCQKSLQNNSKENSQKSHCSIKNCPRTKKIRICHICHKLYCPFHLFQHLHC